MTDRLETWAIVELFGHTKMAGMVSESSIAGGTFLRIDVPEIPVTLNEKAVPGFTRYVGPSAVFAINPVSEEIARRMVHQLRARPVQPYEMPAQRLLPAPSEDQECADPPRHFHMSEWDQEIDDEDDDAGSPA